MPDETCERLPGCGLSILQKRRGYRFSVDAVLLAAFAHLGAGSHAAELGSGSGVVSLVLAARHDRCRVTGWDIQDAMVDMANRSAALNRLDDRVIFSRGDIRDMPHLCEAASRDAVFFNPPYRKAGTGRLNLLPEKALARHELHGALDDFIAAAAFLLRDEGRLFAVYPARRSVSLVALLRHRGIEPKTLQFVHSDAASPAVFILVEGIKGGGEEVFIPPPLVMYEAPGAYSGDMTAVLEGRPLRSGKGGSGTPGS